MVGMIRLEVYTDGKPSAWAASKASRFHFYDPKAKEKEEARWQLKAQYNDSPIKGPVHLDFTFFFPIPKNTSSVRRRQMLNHVILPTVNPDTTNMQKLYEDCLKGIVIDDDRLCTDISSRKRYSETPRVLIQVIAKEEFKEHIPLVFDIPPEPPLTKSKKQKTSKIQKLQGDT